MTPPISHETDEAETAAFLGQVVPRTRHGHLVRACIVNLYANRPRVAAHGDVEGSALARRRMDDGVGSQLGGKQDSVVHYGQWAEDEPDELSDAGDLVKAAQEGSLDLDGLEMTLEILSDTHAVARISESLAALGRGELGADMATVRQGLTHRRVTGA